MSFAQFLSFYLNLNLLVVLGFGGLSLYSIVRKKFGSNLSARSHLRLHYGVLLTILGLTLLQPFLPKSEFYSPPAKVWSASSIKSFGQDYDVKNDSGFISLPTPSGSVTLQADQFAQLWTLIGIALLIFAGFLLSKDLWSLLCLQRNSFLLKQCGQVSIFLSDSISVPFSFWLPGRANILIPTSLMSFSSEFRIAITHEIQHHRQGDTKWVYTMLGLRMICFINPAIYFWNQWISEIQEFACDETLVDQKNVDSQDYARCLLRVAQTAINRLLKNS